MMKENLYIYCVILQPADESKRAELVIPPTPILARTHNEAFTLASIKAGENVPDEDIPNLDIRVQEFKSVFPTF